MSLTPLHLQPLAPATSYTKIRLALPAKSLCDALCGPVEFHPPCFKTPFVTHTAPNDNFGLPAGVWTDNTSMALALARSITTFDAGGGDDAKGKTEEQEGGSKGNQGKGGMDAADRLDAYYCWSRAGELSAMGRCFDIGNTIQRALGLYKDTLRAAGTVDAPCSVLRALFTRSDQEWRRKAAAAALPRIARNLGGSVFGGNGSLMRVLPVGLTYRSKEEGKVGDLTRENSGTTHPNVVCQEACAVWAMCIVRVVRTAAVVERMQEGLGMMKLDVLHHFVSYSYTTLAEQEALVADVPLPATLARDLAAMEAHYAAYHHLLCLVVTTLRASIAAATAEDGITNPNTDADGRVEARMLADLPQPAALLSSGYVVHTLAAVLYVFLATGTFEAGRCSRRIWGTTRTRSRRCMGGWWVRGMPLRRTVGSRPRGRKHSFGHLGCESGERAWVKYRAAIVVGDLSEADVVRDRADRDDNFVGEVYGVEASFDPGQ
ncbi:ADP-ribosylation/Crystallin J1 [Mycena albidolilacea]|uniref:ADP-ribosylhydrolase ARH3 n=1 Tax=Mycena albidolilacea TaxID=1033008 RepID=A0AAD7EVF5_9AGAR|nr:ADP-ribosylation/Crystallin J1 [Mycena albidolilacea]